MLLFLSKWSFLGTFACILLLSKDAIYDSFGLRPEDFMSFIVLLILPFLIIKIYKLIHPGLLISILFYFIYVVTISTINHYDYLDKIIVLMLKELSYFGYFLVTFFLVIRNSKKDISKLLLFIFIFSFPPLIYIFYQFYTGVQGMYGVSFYGHTNSPASSGLLALMLTFLSYIYFVFFKNWLIILYCFICGIVVIFGGSKLAAVGLLSFAFLNAFIEVNKTKMLYGVSFLAILFVGLLVSINSGIGALHRLQTIFSPIEVIKERGIWFKTEWIDGLPGYIFGGGVGKGHILNGNFSLGMAMDNQFLYFLIVLGFFGTVIFLFVLLFLVVSHPKKSLQRKIQIVLIFTFFAMGMGAEVFQLSISGITFWVISGFLAGYSKKIEVRNKYEDAKYLN
jgi:hypothetical protein